MEGLGYGRSDQGQVSHEGAAFHGKPCEFHDESECENVKR